MCKENENGHEVIHVKPNEMVPNPSLLFPATRPLKSA